jgi:hypothetical protein
MIDKMTLQVVQPLHPEPTSEWGSPQLRRIFNFRARQVTSIYERGGLQSFPIPRGGSSYASEAGYTAAVTSAINIQNFRDIEGQDEIAEMHAELRRLGGKPPPLEDVLEKCAKTKLVPKI